MGPRQITGSSLFCSRNPTDSTLRPPISTGSMPFSPPSRRYPTSPSMVGTLGPCRSTSSNPTRCPASIADMARFTATVLLPTPPLPDITMILRRMRFRRAFSLASSCAGAACCGAACCREAQEASPQLPH